MWIFIIVAVVFAYLLGLLDPEAWLNASGNLSRFLSELYIREDLLGDALYAVGDTFVMALFATVVGFLISFHIAVMSVREITPRPVALAFRAVANVIRTVPAIFWGILFVIMFGPGRESGALALVLYTTGYLSKFFYETLENVGKEHYEALQSMGLSWLILGKALFKHTEKQNIANIMFMLEYNLRTASILGIVGAGGVGYYIIQYVNILDYAAAFTFFVVILVFVFALDGLSHLVRKRF